MLPIPFSFHEYHGVMLMTPQKWQNWEIVVCPRKKLQFICLIDKDYQVLHLQCSVRVGKWGDHSYPWFWVHYCTYKCWPSHWSLHHSSLHWSIRMTRAACLATRTTWSSTALLSLMSSFTSITRLYPSIVCMRQLQQRSWQFTISWASTTLADPSASPLLFWQHNGFNEE